MRVTRRGLGLSAIGNTIAAIPLTGCAGSPMGDEPIPPLGATRWSESVSFSAIADDGMTGFVVRLCRYPDDGVSWLWAHCFANRHVYALSLVDLPCEANRTNLSSEFVQYRARGEGAAVEFARSGPQLEAAAVTLGTQLAMSQRARADHGAGDISVSINAEFVPTAGFPGVVRGRSELSGLVDGELVIDGQRIALRCHGHFHEQPQSGPRFTTPFGYLTGWGADTAFTLVRSAAGGAGTLLHRGQEIGVRNWFVSPPGRLRNVTIETEQGTVSASLRATHQYGVRIYDGWRQSMVAVGTLVLTPVALTSVVALLNDWRPELLDYDEPAR